MIKIGFRLVVAIVLLVLFACDKNRVFETYKPVTGKGWHKDSVMTFTIPVKDTLSNHNLYINIRNDINYKYSNLWLFVALEQPGGVIAKDTFELVLADPAGKWLGEGIAGIKTSMLVYKRNVFFPVTGEYKFTIRQGMRETVLPHLTDVGVRVEKVN